VAIYPSTLCIWDVLVLPGVDGCYMENEIVILTVDAANLSGIF